MSRELLFFYDTETTGFPDYKAPSDAEHQPHIVQLAGALVCAESREVIQSMDVICEPDGWDIPEQASNVHGITTELAKEVGIPEPLAINMFVNLWLRSHCRVAHNESFDYRIIRIALKRHMGDLWAGSWKQGKAKCTQSMATPILKLPPTERMLAVGRTHHKTANLSEAYEFFTGNQLEGAHSAMVDVKACIEVFWAAQEPTLAF